MNKYIESEKVIEMLNSKIEGLKLFGSLYTSQTMRAFEHLAEQIANLPAADVSEVVHSNWIIVEDERRCPICHFFYTTTGVTSYDYCPGCDAKMDGGLK